MPCCAKRAMASCAHSLLTGKGAESEGRRSVAASHPCGCEMRSAPAAFPASKTALPSSVVLLPTKRPIVSISKSIEAAPGLVGLDAGPPPDPPRLGDASRAPPVVRA